MERQQIIMNFSAPPSADDIQVIAADILTNFPEELSELCEGLTIQVEDFPDEAVESELDLEGPYDLMALYRRGSQIAPGVERKVANDDDILIIYRRPLLDMWCETGEDLNALVRQVMIEEVAQNFEFPEDDIEELAQRHYQGVL